MKRNYLMKGALLLLTGALSIGLQAQTTYNYTGSMQTYTVPAGVNSIKIEAWGAEGGDGFSNSVGGKGGYAVGEITVIPGATLNVYVGGEGETAGPNGSAGGTGGFNGGGDGGDDFVGPQGAGGGGGGASDVRIGGTALTDRVIVAGAGGGASTSSLPGGGFGGGLVGGNGVDYGSNVNATGGTQSSGGAGGIQLTHGSGFPGGLGFGGEGATGQYGAGCGGGGGYYGGGGGMGGYEGTGGGGSSYIALLANASTTQDVRLGNGKVVITVLCAGLNITTTGNTVCAGSSVTLAATSSGVGVITWDNGITNGVSFVPSTSTTYTTTSSDSDDCGATVSVVVLQPSSSTSTFVECDGFSITVGSNIYSSTGVYTDVFTAANGCDSTVTTDLTVMAPITNLQTLVECSGFSISIGANTYTSTGVYVDVFTAVNGCDSTVITDLTVLAPVTNLQTLVECSGFSITVGANTHTSTGVYTDVLTSVNGCDSTVTTDLTINTLPFILLNSFNNDTVCNEGMTQVLPSANPVGGSYSGLGIVGGDFDPIVAGVGTHYVVYSYTDLNGCVNSDSAIIVVSLCVGLDENNLLSDVKVFPNPARNVLNVELADLRSEVNLVLFSVDGKIVYERKNITEKFISIDISMNSKGVYFLQISNNKDLQVHKVIKR